MPVLLLGMGVFAVVAGLVMVGFGIPINEFSFGNTLISSGTTAAVGGLVIIAVGVAVGHLRRIAGMLGDRAQLPLPLDELEPAPAPRKAQSAPGSQPGRAPFPPRSKERPMESPMDDPFAMEPEPAPKSAFKPGASLDERQDQSFAPSLRNPDEGPVPVDDDISLSPRHPQGAPAPAAIAPGSLDRTSDSFDWRVPPASNAPAAPLRPQPANFDAIPAARPQPANFDAMWPAEGRVEGKVAKAPQPASPSGAPAAAPGAGVRPRTEPQMANEAVKDAAKPRTVAILKSGVVDGMGYTLYVDGSIEAELPQGTLRFASINELRSHLEKNT